MKQAATTNGEMQNEDNTTTIETRMPTQDFNLLSKQTEVATPNAPSAFEIQWDVQEATLVATQYSIE